MQNKELKKQYMRERRRIQRTLRSYTKRGLDVNVTLPVIPKKITAGSVRRLKNISLTYIRQHSQGPNFETGEVLNYIQFTRQVQKQKREAKARMQAVDAGTATPALWMVGLDRVKEILEDYYVESKEIFMRAIERDVGRYGEIAVGNALFEMVSEGLIPEPDESYKKGLVLHATRELANRLHISEMERRAHEKEVDDYNSGFEDFEGEFDEW